MCVNQATPLKKRATGDEFVQFSSLYLGVQGDPAGVYMIPTQTCQGSGHTNTPS